MASTVAAWPTVALGEVARTVERPETPIAGRLYRQAGVRLWGQGVYEREPIDGSATQYRTLSRIETDDIIVNKIWARNGSVSVVSSELAGAYVSGEFPTFEAAHDRLLPQWFFWLTKTRSFWEQCDELSRGTSGKNRIRPEKFLQVQVPLPPFDEQRRIVARLEALAARIAEARGLRQAAMAETDALVPAVTESAIAGTTARAVELALVLREASLNGLAARPSDTPVGTPILRISAGTTRADGIVDEADYKYLDVDEATIFKYRLQPGDLVACRFNGNLSNVGKFALYSGCSGATHIFPDKLIRFRTNPLQAIPRYVCIAMNSRCVRANVEAMCATTAGNIGISAGKLKMVRLPLPSLTDQRWVVQQVEAVHQQAESVQRLQSEAGAELDALLPSLLDRAFRGEL